MPHTPSHAGPSRFAQISPLIIAALDAITELKGNPGQVASLRQRRQLQAGADARDRQRQAEEQALALQLEIQNLRASGPGGPVTLGGRQVTIPGTDVARARNFAQQASQLEAQQQFLTEPVASRAFDQDLLAGQAGPPRETTRGAVIEQQAMQDRLREITRDLRIRSQPIGGVAAPGAPPGETIGGAMLAEDVARANALAARGEEFGFTQQQDRLASQERVAAARSASFERQAQIGAIDPALNRGLGRAAQALGPAAGESDRLLAALTGKEDLLMSPEERVAAMQRLAALFSQPGGAQAPAPAGPAPSGVAGIDLLLENVDPAFREAILQLLSQLEQQGQPVAAP